MNIREAWEIVSSDSNVAVAGENSPACRVAIRVHSGCGYVGVEISADEWREIVQAVERRLIQRGDPQR